MGKCKNHIEVETGYFCHKHNYYMCKECLRCSDPDIYCKFRPSCVVHFIEKKGGKNIDKQ